MRLGLWKIPAVAGATLLAGAGALYLYSPPKSLDVLDALWPGETGGERVAAALPFGDAGLKLDIWSAKGDQQATKPVLVFFYGGAWVKGRRQDYGFVGRAFARRGYVVVLPDYRKVPGVRFPVFVNDGAAAVRWVHDNIARYGGDPNRVALAGHSAGAYVAVMLAMDPRYVQRAGADPTVVRAAAGLAGPYDFYPFDSARAVAAMGNAADPRQTQPITFARKEAPPLWLGTGTADTEVRPRNSGALARRERELGNGTTVLREYKGFDHDDMIMAVSKPFRSKGPVLDDVVAFLDRAMPSP